MKSVSSLSGKKMGTVTMRNGEDGRSPGLQTPQQLCSGVSLQCIPYSSGVGLLRCDKGKRACSIPCLVVCRGNNVSCFLEGWALVLLKPGVSLQTYAPCPKNLALAWHFFIVGGTIRRRIPAPGSSMVAAKETTTISSPKPCARTCAPAIVSPWGVLSSLGPCQQTCV